MKRVHLAALACFVVALLFYAMSWSPGYGVLVVLGLVLEAAAWLLVWAGPDEPRQGPPSP